MTADDVDRLLSRVSKPVVVLDEAYYEFANDFAARRGVSYSRSLDYVREGRNVVVLRTFSKVHGLAGARVGYGIASAELITRIARQRPMYCVSSVAQAGALAALEDSAHIRKAVENNTEQSEKLFQIISAMGIAVTPTWGNFLYCEMGRDARVVAERLRLDGILVRPLDQWGAPHAIRITIGTPEQNEALVAGNEKLEGCLNRSSSATAPRRTGRRRSQQCPSDNGLGRTFRILLAPTPPPPRIQRMRERWQHTPKSAAAILQKRTERMLPTRSTLLRRPHTY